MTHWAHGVVLLALGFRFGTERAPRARLVITARVPGYRVLPQMRYLTASSHESMKSLACSHASFTASSVYSLFLFL